MPVRTPLPIELPEPMAAQLRSAAAQQAAAQQAAVQGAQQAGNQPQPAARRTAPGSAIEQLRTITGG